MDPTRLRFPAPTSAGTFDHYELRHNYTFVEPGDDEQYVRPMSEDVPKEEIHEVFWSIYGLTNGIATHLADRDTREDADELLRGIGVLLPGPCPKCGGAGKDTDHVRDDGSHPACPRCVGYGHVHHEEQHERALLENVAELASHFATARSLPDQGGAFSDLVIQWALEFHAAHRGRLWDGDYWETIEKFFTDRYQAWSEGGGGGRENDRSVHVLAAHVVERIQPALETCLHTSILSAADRLQALRDTLTSPFYTQ